MTKKRTNENMAGALFFVTFNVQDRCTLFTSAQNCRAFLAELQELRRSCGLLLIAFVLMPDHGHLVVNPREGDIRFTMSRLKSLSAKKLVALAPTGRFQKDDRRNQVWQESFHSLPLWSAWMIKQKIDYIHANPVVAKLSSTAENYPWSSFRSFYREENDPLLQVDQEWWREGDLEILESSVRRWEDNRISELRAAIESNMTKLKRG